MVQLITVVAFAYSLITVSALPSSFTSRSNPGTGSFASQSICNGKTYTYDAMAGYGFVPNNARDKFGDSMSIGSSIKIEQDSWKFDKKTGLYSGIFWGLPDRGW